MNGNTLIGSKEVARRLGLSADSVRRLVDLGRLPAYQYAPGGKLLFDPEDVEALVERAHRKPVAV